MPPSHCSPVPSFPRPTAPLSHCASAPKPNSNLDLQWDRGTTGLGHNETKRDGDVETVGPGHNGTKRDGDVETVGPGHNGTKRDGDVETVGPGHNGIGTQWDGGTMGGPL